MKQVEGILYEKLTLDGNLMYNLTVVDRAYTHTLVRTKFR